MIKVSLAHLLGGAPPASAAGSESAPSEPGVFARLLGKLTSERDAPATQDAETTPRSLEGATLEPPAAEPRDSTPAEAGADVGPETPSATPLQQGPRAEESAVAATEEPGTALDGDVQTAAAPNVSGTGSHAEAANAATPPAADSQVGEGTDGPVVLDPATVRGAESSGPHPAQQPAPPRAEPDGRARPADAPMPRRILQALRNFQHAVLGIEAGHAVQEQTSDANSDLPTQIAIEKGRSTPTPELAVAGAGAAALIDAAAEALNASREASVDGAPSADPAEFASAGIAEADGPSTPGEAVPSEQAPPDSTVRAVDGESEDVPAPAARPGLKAAPNERLWNRIEGAQPDASGQSLDATTASAPADIAPRKGDLLDTTSVSAADSSAPSADQSVDLSSGSAPDGVANGAAKSLDTSAASQAADSAAGGAETLDAMSLSAPADVAPGAAESLDTTSAPQSPDSAAGVAAPLDATSGSAPDDTAPGAVPPPDTSSTSAKNDSERVAGESVATASRVARADGATGAAATPGSTSKSATDSSAPSAGESAGTREVRSVEPVGVSIEAGASANADSTISGAGASTTSGAAGSDGVYRDDSLPATGSRTPGLRTSNSTTPPELRFAPADGDHANPSVVATADPVTDSADGGTPADAVSGAPRAGRLEFRNSNSSGIGLSAQSAESDGRPVPASQAAPRSGTGAALAAATEINAETDGVGSAAPRPDAPQTTTENGGRSTEANSPASRSSVGQSEPLRSNPASSAAAEPASPVGIEQTATTAEPGLSGREQNAHPRAEAQRAAVDKVDARTSAMPAADLGNVDVESRLQPADSPSPGPASPEDGPSLTGPPSQPDEMPAPSARARPDGLSAGENTRAGGPVTQPETMGRAEAAPLPESPASGQTVVIGNDPQENPATPPSADIALEPSAAESEKAASRPPSSEQTFGEILSIRSARRRADSSDVADRGRILRAALAPTTAAPEADPVPRSSGTQASTPVPAAPPAQPASPASPTAPTGDTAPNGDPAPLGDSPRAQSEGSNPESSHGDQSRREPEAMTPIEPASPLTIDGGADAAPTFELADPMEMPPNPLRAEPSESAVLDFIQEFMRARPERAERRSTFPMSAWLRARQSDGPAPPPSPDGWHEVQMRLADEQGAMRIRARRTDDRVTVLVQASDPRVQAQLTESVSRLQASLEEQYGTEVDLTFESGAESETPSGRPRDHNRLRRESTFNTPTATADSARRLGASNVWVG